MVLAADIKMLRNQHWPLRKRLFLNTFSKTNKPATNKKIIPNKHWPQRERKSFMTCNNKMTILSTKHFSVRSQMFFLKAGIISVRKISERKTYELL